MAVRLAAPPPAAEQVSRYTWSSAYSRQGTEEPRGVPWRKTSRVQSPAVTAVITVISW